MASCVSITQPQPVLQVVPVPCPLSTSEVIATCPAGTSEVVVPSPTSATHEGGFTDTSKPETEADSNSPCALQERRTIQKGLTQQNNTTTDTPTNTYPTKQTHKRKRAPVRLKKSSGDPDGDLLVQSGLLESLKEYTKKRRDIPGFTELLIKKLAESRECGDTPKTEQFQWIMMDECAKEAVAQNNRKRLGGDGCIRT